MNIAVIFAGGIGRRMNSKALPKQFLKLYGKEIIIYTLEHFEKHKDIDAIVIACVEDWIPFLNELLPKYQMKKVKKVVPGGSSGQESIYHGLLAAREISDGNSIVLVHDGVRPLINGELITKCIETVKEKGNAITVAPVIETIIRSEDNGKVSSIIDRSQCMVARAPQCFWLNELLECHEKSCQKEKFDFIDSASMMAYYGKELFIVNGPVENIKITTPMDFYTFKALCGARENSQLFGASVILMSGG